MRRIIITLAALAVIVSACATAADPSPTTTVLRSRSTIERTGVTPRAILASFALVPFDQCEAFLDHVKTEAAEVVGPYGLDGYGGGYFPFDDVRALAVEEAPQAAVGGAGSDFSGTNIQELPRKTARLHAVCSDFVSAN